MSSDEIGFAILVLTVAVMTLFATLKWTAPGPYALAAIVSVFLLKTLAWSFSWWVVVSVTLFVVLVSLWIITRPPNDPPNPPKQKLYLFGPTTGGVARRIRFDDS